jgi:hypothetical protein
MPATSPQQQNAAAAIYVIGLTLLYLVVALHTPVLLFALAPHDDGLFISLGQYLAQGKWLGPFNQFTLMKGPGYPAFLAVSHWLGVSITLAHALFHCAAVLVFVAVAYRFMRSYLLSGLLFALLLWQPTSLSLLRVLRDRLYLDQILTLLACLMWMLFAARSDRERAIAGAVSGAMLGWIWLTREEGLWLVPALAVLFAVGLFHARRADALRGFAISGAIFLALFATAQIGFAAANWWAYGKFIGVDFKEANFRRALGALAGVRSGETKPYILVTSATRKRIYEVSPAFASLAADLDGGMGQGWVKTSCALQPETCGEIGAGWFMWALRDAVAHAGHYASPAEASAFYGRIADEIAAACADGRLQCSAQPIPEMPAVTFAEMRERLPGSLARAIDVLLLYAPTPELPQSASLSSSVGKSLRFLNRPRRVTIADADTISGWYYGLGDEWISATVKSADGSPVDARFERSASPDIATHFKDAEATAQRYTLKVKCTATCRLELESESGAKAELTFAQLGTAPATFPLGKGTFFVDEAVFRGKGQELTRIDLFSNRVLGWVFKGYRFLLLPVAAIGAVAFLATSLLYWRRALWNACFLFAVSCWILVLSRMGLLILIDLTSFPPLIPLYVAPAYYLLASAAVLSCAAWLQLSKVTSPSTHKDAVQWS